MFSTSIFVEVAFEREHNAHVRALKSGSPTAALAIIAANARVDDFLADLYYHTMAREMGYGEPRFASISEERRYYDAPIEKDYLESAIDSWFYEKTSALPAFPGLS